MILFMVTKDGTDKEFLLNVNKVEVFVPLSNGHVEAQLESGRHIEISKSIQQIEQELSRALKQA